MSVSLTMVKMGHFPEKHKLPKLTQEVTEHLNKSKANKEAELVI